MSNTRVGIPQAMTINGVDAGGLMQASISAGYDNVLRSSPDGLQVPLKDREIQFVRGTITTQDWIEMINLLTGVVGTYVFYERKSGVAAATGYVKHTINNPVIYQCSLNFTKGGYATATFAFECRPAAAADGIAALWVITDSQSAPTYIAAARGGYRVVSAVHGGNITLLHVTAFNFSLAMPLVKACNDADVGYTCVDARLDGLSAAGSIAFQSAAISNTQMILQQLVIAERDTLVLNVTQGQGAAAKIITIAGADFNNVVNNSDVGSPFTGYTASYEVSNNVTTQLTLADANKIITVENAV